MKYAALFCILRFLCGSRCHFTPLFLLEHSKVVLLLLFILAGYVNARSLPLLSDHLPLISHRRTVFHLVRVDNVIWVIVHKVIILLEEIALHYLEASSIGVLAIIAHLALHLIELGAKLRLWHIVREVIVVLESASQRNLFALLEHLLRALLLAALRGCILIVHGHALDKVVLLAAWYLLGIGRGEGLLVDVLVD